MAPPPNMDFGSPAIFFDSHPEEQESYLYSYWSSLKTSFHIAWTGQVPKPLERGTLRLIFWTTEGTQGMKDYELHDYAIVREAFDEALKQPDVRRCMVMGFSGQNPYVNANGGSNPWVDKFARDQKAEKERAKVREQQFTDSEEGRKGKEVDIEDVIERNDEWDEWKRKRANDVNKAVATHVDAFIDSSIASKTVKAISGESKATQHDPSTQV